MGFPRQEYWSGLPFLSPGDLPDPGIETRSPTLQPDSLPSEPPGQPTHIYVNLLAWPKSSFGFFYVLYTYMYRRILRLFLDFLIMTNDALKIFIYISEYTCMEISLRAYI